MTRNKDICYGCQCYDCVFDYGNAICSQFGSVLCKNCYGFNCDMCKIINGKPSNYIIYGNNDTISCPDRVTLEEQLYKQGDWKK